jgi:hypothetical protein
VHSGWVVSALLLLPNLLWLAFPRPQSTSSQVGGLPPWVVGLQSVEMALRAAVFALPFFLTVDFAQPQAGAALVVASLTLCFYYGAWCRYFTNGRAIRLLFNSWLGVPVPLAIAPVVYLAAASVLTRSVLLGIVTDGVTVRRTRVRISAEGRRRVDSSQRSVGGSTPSRCGRSSRAIVIANEHVPFASAPTSHRR